MITTFTHCGESSTVSFQWGTIEYMEIYEIEDQVQKFAVLK